MNRKPRSHIFSENPLCEWAWIMAIAAACFTLVLVVPQGAA